MPLHDFSDLLRTDEHSLDLGGLIRAPLPSDHSHVRAPAGARAGERGGKIAGREPDQRVVLIQRCHQHFADLAFGNGISCPRSHDFDEYPFVDDESLVSYGFVRNVAQIRSCIALQATDASICVIGPDRGKQRAGAHCCFLDPGQIQSRFVRAFQDGLEIVRSAGVRGHAEVRGGNRLQFRIADAGRKHRRADRSGPVLEYRSGGRHVVRKTVLHQIILAYAASMQEPPHPPPVARGSAGFVDRSGRLEHVVQVRNARRDQSPERRVLRLQGSEPRLPQHRQRGKSLQGIDFPGVDVPEQCAEPCRLGSFDLLRQLQRDVLGPLVCRPDFALVVIVHFWNARLIG